MPIRVVTRHPPEFHIFTDAVDPAKSRYADLFPDYVSKISQFYDQIGIRSAIWTIPESQRPDHVETCKPVEYLLEIDESRVVAYIDELTWSPYLQSDRSSFEFATSPMEYEKMSILVAAPITKRELVERRILRCE